MQKKSTPKGVLFRKADEGFDRIKERLGQALAGGAHPRRI